MALNDTLAGNRKLREQINHIRNERSVFYKLYNKVSAELEECKKKKAAILMSTSQALEQRYIDDCGVLFCFCT